jgi:predicted RecB family nuclease
MKKIGSNLLFSPSDLIRFMESEFASWMDRHYVELKKFPPDPDSAEKKVVYESGNAHENTYLSLLKSGPDKVFIIDKDSKDFASAHADTQVAIHANARVIYQPALQDPSGLFQGYADFLELENGSYIVCDTKLGRSLRPYYVVQLCAYAEMLAPLVGSLPQKLAVILAPTKDAARAGQNFKRESLRTQDYFDYYLWLKKRFLDFHTSFRKDIQHRPEPDPRADHGRWQSYADRWIRDTDHLSQVANIHSTHIKKLHDAGITRMEVLATLKAEKKVPKLSTKICARLVNQAGHQLKTLQAREKRLDTPPSFAPLQDGILGQLPATNPGDIFFDMEGYPYYEDHTGLEYLFGVAYYESPEKLAYQSWWAHDKEAEKKAIIGFLDWAKGRLQRHPGAHIYHYASYEKTALGNLCTHHATHEEILDHILRSGDLVDLYPFVRKSFVIGEESYSLKSVEKLYRPGARSTAVAGAMDSVVKYHHWTQLGRDPASGYLKELEEYNRDDCFSTAELFRWLHEQKKSVASAPSQAPTAPIQSEETKNAYGPQETTRLLLADKPHAELLIHLSEFHWREAKPTFWDFYRRHETPGADLESDPSCIAQARLEKPEERPVSPAGKVDLSGFNTTYRFDPSQDLRIGRRDELFFQGQPHSKPLRIVELDEDEGRLVLASGESGYSETSFVSLNHVRPHPIPAGIRSAIESYAGDKHPLLLNLLNRSRPAGPSLSSSGPLCQPVESLAQAGLRIAQAMEHSVLCIQGPPGTGKTTTGAEIIAHLIVQGKRVGITSNSHEAINLLASRVGDALQISHSIKLSGIKHSTEKNLQLHFQHPGLKHSKEAGKAVYLYNVIKGLACGTAWLFSRDDWAGALDYLFIDEASQVALANAVGMSRSASNIVLLGDQMQLEQPSQGKHPGEAGLSVLNYYLNGHDTVPPELGIFLNISYRLHPEICSFVSRHCYEDRLKPAPGNENQAISLSSSARWVKKPAGILFSAVVHDDRGQGSEAEADRCREIYDELLGQTFTAKDGKTRALGLEDFLFISPYNLQARYIRERLPNGARVASVDKFQGKEAPVCILSLGCGGRDPGPRGLSFVLDRSRLNVAVSRTQALFILVANPNLVYYASSGKELHLANAFCKLTSNII